MVVPGHTIEIAQALPALYGPRDQPGTIRQWIKLRPIPPLAWLYQGAFYWQRQDEPGGPLCRIGDVIDLA